MLECFRWNSYETNLLSTFEGLLDSEALSDVTLFCEGEYFLSSSQVSTIEIMWLIEKQFIPEPAIVIKIIICVCSVLFWICLKFTMAALQVPVYTLQVQFNSISINSNSNRFFLQLARIHYNLPYWRHTCIHWLKHVCFVALFHWCHWKLIDFAEKTCFQTVQTKNGFCKIQIVFSGESFKAHRLVLAACSAHFSKLFSNSTLNGQLIVILEGTHHQDLQILLQFMYKGVAYLHQDRIESVLRTAEVLQVKRTLSLKSSQLVKHLAEKGKH